MQAGTARDAFFGQGYAAAQDRLWQMAYDRCRAYGRWAAWVGPAGVPFDRVQRRYRMEAAALSDYAAADAPAQAMLAAYADGVNAAIAATKLPREFEILRVAPDPWHPWDCLAVLRLRHQTMGSYERKLWRWRVVRSLGPARSAAAFPDLVGAREAFGRWDAVFPEEVLRGLDRILGMPGPAPAGGLEGGSNSWALSGARTATGLPLLAGDPHRALEFPNVYYQNHIACREFDVVGLSFPGCPGFPHFGHNPHVAWAVTHAGADTQDLYVERFLPGDPPRYAVAGGWRPAQTYPERIAVAGGASEAVSVTVTDHGPVILGGPEDGIGLALREAARPTDSTVRAIRSMLGARSAGELEGAMEAWCDPVNNLLSADRSGDIRLLVRGRIPVRDALNAWLPVPGWTGRHEWGGTIPFDALPRRRNPPEGFIVSANNRVVSEIYPYHISLVYAPEFRARRIEQLLRGLSAATPAAMAALHGDVRSLPASAYLERLRTLRPTLGEPARARALLKGWDGAMDRDGIAPTLYRAFRDALDRRFAREALGPLAGALLSGAGRGAEVHARSLSAWVLAQATTGGGGLESGEWDAILEGALAEGWTWLQERLGHDATGWKWGLVHQVAPVHPLAGHAAAAPGELARPALPVPGDGDTVNAGSYSQAVPFAVTIAPVARYVFDVGDWDASGWIVPGGASGRTGDPHSDDQTSAWQDARLIPMLFSWERITRDAAATDSLPGLGGEP